MLQSVGRERATSGMLGLYGHLGRVRRCGTGVFESMVSLSLSQFVRLGSSDRSIERIRSSPTPYSWKDQFFVCIVRNFSYKTKEMTFQYANQYCPSTSRILSAITLSGRIVKVVASHAEVARSIPGWPETVPTYTVHEALRDYFPWGWGCDQSIISTVSDGIVRSWLWSTATRSSPLGYFSGLLQLVDNWPHILW